MTPGTGGDRSVIADVALALAGTQILAQVADDASLDGRATGLIGFNGALLAVTIAAKGLLGTFWWAPPVVVVISTLMLLRALYGRFIDQRSSKLGLHSADIGVGARPFYEGYAEQPALAAQEVLLRDLSKSVDNNVTRIKDKRLRLRRATLFLLAGLFVSACLIAAVRPTKVETCLKIQVPGQQSKKALCLSLLPRGSFISGQTVRSPAPEATGELLKLAARIEGGTHGVLYEIAELAEGQQ